MMRARRFTALLFIVIIAAGCSQEPHQSRDVPDEKAVKSEQTNEKDMSADKAAEKDLVPLSDSEFFSAEDWTDESSIYYLSENAGGSVVYQYNLFTGERKPFFETEASIVQLSINRESGLLAVHSSPTSYEASITVLDQSGNIRTERSFPSTELNFSWSPSGEKLFITAFDENWSFETFLLSMSDYSLEKNPVELPFIQWLTDDEITYLKWNEAEPQLTAPLAAYSLQTKEERILEEHIISHAHFGEYTFSIKVENEEESTGTYLFFKNGELLYSFDVPLTPLYSEWLIPEYDTAEGVFYTFIPGDTEGKFDLTAVDPEKETMSTIIENVDNSPISLSPDGEYALYGSYREKLIHLKDGEIKSIVK
ncbi:hypothetical protein [Metabacillus sp. cB07]|uniref:YqgU-like beta propeller domain-containing protein n=1 Tax=Metabacillus sp. cB07 TaxID=2806989 RepID=UPI001939B96B|nr:hypothetical protein [Metabacillus sp. cB07]